MARWAPARRDVLEALATEIAGLYGHGRAIVAVDGPAESGTKPFADDLAEALRLLGHRVLRASIADFHRPRADRPDSPEGYYHEAFDYSVLRRVLIDPFRTAGSTGVVLAAFDEARDAAIQPKWVSAGLDVILVIDGVFLNRPELTGLWNYSLWLDTAESPAGSDAIYEAQAKPRTAAVAIIDVRDPEHPRRIFADAC